MSTYALPDCVTWLVGYIIVFSRMQARRSQIIDWQSNFRLNLRALRAAGDLYAEHERPRAVYQLRTLEAGVVNSPDRLSTIYAELADLAMVEFNDNVAAYRWAVKLNKLLPGDEKAQNILSELEAEGGESVVRYDATIEEGRGIRDRRARAQFLADTADSWYATAPDDPWLVELLFEVLRHDARQERAHELLTEIYRTGERWLELSQYLSMRLSKTPRKDDRITLMRRLAHLAQTHLGDSEQALDWYRQLLKLSPLDEESLNFCVDYCSPE